MNILLTNDDGVGAEGLAVLARHVSHWVSTAPDDEERQAIIVAPMTNYSGMSSAVGDVFDRPTVPYIQHHLDGVTGVPTYGLDAPPALCAILGALGNFDFVPDVVLSGINAGANVGRSILHSGTIGAILTGAQLGLSGLAVSVQWSEKMHYDTAATLAVELLESLATAPRGTLYNLNVPNVPLEELSGIRRGRVSRAGVVKAPPREEPFTPLAHDGEIPLRVGAASPQLGDVSDEAADEDGALVAAGFASLTPLRGPSEDTSTPTNDALVLALANLEGLLATHR